MPSGSWHVSRNRQRLWQLFFTGIFHDQHVVASRWQTASQLNRQLCPETPVSAPQESKQPGHFLSALTHIVTATHRHVGMAGGHSLSWAWVWQMVVIHTAGVVSRDGGGGVKRQIPVQQTAGDTPTKKTSAFQTFSSSEKKNKRISSCDSTVTV